MNSETFLSFSDELQKIAARRGLKEIRKAVAGGNIERASSLAKTPGVLKPTAHGSEIKDLGHGGEGLATMVAHPQHGVAVRKIYNPNAVTDKLVARKERAAELTKNNPNVAKTYSASNTPGGSRAHMMEYVHGSEVKPSPQNYQAVKNTRQSLQKDLKRGGMVAQDVRPQNMIQTPSGQAKLVDYIPGKTGDFESGNTRNRVNQQLKAQGQSTLPKSAILGTNQAPEMLKGVSSHMTSSGLLKGQAFRGATPGHAMPRGNTAATKVTPMPSAAPPVPPAPAANLNAPTRAVRAPRI